MICLAGAAAVLVACNSAGYGTGPSNPTIGTRDVSVGAESFDPANVRPDGSGNVVWTWNTGVTHNIVFEDTTIAGSGNKSSGTFTRSFGSATGTFRFRCTIHSTNFTNGMHGAVLAGAAAPPDTGTGGYGYP